MVSVSGAVRTIRAPRPCVFRAVVAFPAVPPSNIPLLCARTSAVSLVWPNFHRSGPSRQERGRREATAADAEAYVLHRHARTLIRFLDLPEREARPHEEALDGGRAARRRH